MFANMSIFSYYALKVVQKCLTGNPGQYSCKKKSNTKLMFKDTKERKHSWLLYTFTCKCICFFSFSVSLFIKVKFQSMFLLWYPKSNRKQQMALWIDYDFRESSKEKENKPIQYLHYKKYWGNFGLKLSQLLSASP